MLHSGMREAQRKEVEVRYRPTPPLCHARYRHSVRRYAITHRTAVAPYTTPYIVNGMYIALTARPDAVRG
eukprot:1383406-Rhodomonas_salina.1